MRGYETAVIGAVSIPLVVTGILLAGSMGDPPEAGDRPAEHPMIQIGQTCASLRDRGLEISCGAVAFGDTRFNCARVHGEKCPKTRSLTVRNIGRAPVKIIVISGSGPGERNESTTPTLETGKEAALHPGTGDSFLFDIVVRSEGGRSPGRIRIVSIA
jgi:hypothetical protein